MKVERARVVLETASAGHRRAGRAAEADSLQRLAAILRDHDSKSMAAFVTAGKKAENRDKKGTVNS